MDLRSPGRLDAQVLLDIKRFCLFWKKGGNPVVAEYSEVTDGLLIAKSET